MSLFSLVAGSLQVISLVVMGALLFEYRHIHQKRIQVIEAFGGSGLLHRVWRRRALMAVYIGLTLLMSAITIWYWMYFLTFFS